MSASLVGSEMCIRDSDPILCTGGAARTVAAPSMKLSPVGDPSSLEFRPCLLYTSDAADDM
eukprot:3848263-Alexandrium_andersonii.AAC.1